MGKNNEMAHFPEIHRLGCPAGIPRRPVNPAHRRKSSNIVDAVLIGIPAFPVIVVIPAIHHNRNNHNKHGIHNIVGFPLIFWIFRGPRVPDTGPRRLSIRILRNGPKSQDAGFGQ